MNNDNNTNKENKTPEQYIQEIELDTTIPLHSRSDPFKKAFDIYDKENNVKKREEMRWNIWIFDLIPIPIRECEEGFPSKRFGSMLGWTGKDNNKYFYPDPRQFPEEAFEYFMEKMNKVKNPIHKARYADVLWDQENNYDAARIAIDAYISCAEIYWQILGKDKNRCDDPNYTCYALDMVDALSRAIEIASLLSKRELVKKVYSKDLEILEKLYSINKPRWYIEIIKSIFEVKDINKYCDLSFLEKYLKHGREGFLKQNDFHIMREFIDMELSFYKIIGKDLEIKRLQIEIGESFIGEAELRLVGENQSNMVAAHFYQQALEHFGNIGESSRLDELKLKIKKCWEIAEEKEFKRIESKVEIKDEDINEYLNPIKNCSLDDILLFIGLDPILRPNYRKAEESAEKQSKKYVFSSIIPKVIVRNQNPVANINVVEERVVWNFVMGYDVLSFILSIIFKKLKETHNLNAKTLTDYLCSRDFLKSEAKFIERAIERYFLEDFISFLHITTVRIESILRNFLKILNIPSTVERDGVIQEKTLDTILEIPELQYVLRDDVIYFLKIFLSSKEGTNLRHDIAHGLIDFKNCDEIRSNLIIYLLLIFATYEIKEQNSNI